MEEEKPSLNITAALSAHKKQIDEQGKKLGWMNFLIVAVIIVLFVGFAGMFVATASMLWDAWNNKSATYQNLTNQIITQNEKINLLYSQCIQKDAENIQVQISPTP